MSEVTAEWTVHAQLTILHPASKKSHNNNTENIEGNIDDDDGEDESKTNPIKLVYKWSTDDLKHENCFKKGNIIFSTSSDKKKVNFWCEFSLY